MALVTIQVADAGPVAGVVIEFFDLSASFQTSGTSGSDGKVTVDLPDGTYDVGLYKPGISFPDGLPQRIIVSSLLENTFLIPCHVRTLPESMDPRKCKVSGYIVGVDGGRHKSRLLLSLATDLLVYDGNIVDLQSQTEVESDEDGYFEFELLRGRGYDISFIYLQSFLDIKAPAKLAAKVPDAPAVALDKLLFPVPVSAAFSHPVFLLPTGIDPNADVTVTVRWSDSSVRWIGFSWASLKILNSDNRVVEASMSGNSLVLKPLAAGVAAISIDRILPARVIFDPVEPFTSETLTVTVVEP